jgi:hypothetical protein
MFINLSGIYPGGTFIKGAINLKTKPLVDAYSCPITLAHIENDIGNPAAY